MSLNSISSDETPIFKLDVDCFHLIFDWLSLSELIIIGQTCRRLQRIAGNFFQSNYNTKIVRAETDGIFISSIQSNIFSEYIQKVTISGDNLNAYHFIGSNCTNTIKHFRVYGALPENGFHVVQNILKNVQFVEFNECLIDGEFYERCLKYCPNVEVMSVTRSSRIRDKSVIIGTDNKWLLRKYTKLQSFELTDFAYELKANELQTFFEQNQKISQFSTDSKTLWANRQSLLATNTKLDALAIDVYQTKNISNKQEISLVDCVYYLLVELSKREFYKRLQFYMIFIDQENVNKILSLHGIDMVTGEILRIEKPLPKVRAWGGTWWVTKDLDTVKAFPSFLPNVERLFFSKMTMDCLVSFIRHLPKLRMIKIKTFESSDNYQKLDLFILNKERGTLFGARKVYVFVSESVYLHAKWTMAVEYDFVELRRYESFEWQEMCARGKYIRSL